MNHSNIRNAPLCFACLMISILYMLASSRTAYCDTESVGRDTMVAKQDTTRAATTTRGFLSNMFSRPRPRGRPSSSPSRPPKTPCVTTTAEINARLRVISETSAPNGTGVIDLCRSTLDTPLELDEVVSISGQVFSSITIGCEGQKSTSKEPPACAISRTDDSAFFTIGDVTGGVGSEALVERTHEGLPLFQVRAQN